MTNFELNILFDKIWKIWRNKDNEHSARKAMRVLFAQEEVSQKRFFASANIYDLSNHDVRFYHELGNWIRNDLWKDIYEEFRDVEAYEQKLIKRKEDCLEVIREWNSQRLDWWAAISSENERIPIVELAMRSDGFSKNWKAALARLRESFRVRFPERDWRHKIIPSISWFCKIDPENHTVLKLIEGDFGLQEKSTPFDPKKMFGKRKPMNQNEALDAMQKFATNIFKNDNREEVKKADKPSRDQKISAMFCRPN